MATPSTRTICVLCNKETRTYLCDGCSQRFCRKHLDEHHKDLEGQLDQVETQHDQLREMINQRKENAHKHPVMNEIDQWETESIEKIKQTANQCREKLVKCTNFSIVGIEKKLHDLAQQIIQIRRENEFNDLDLNELKQRLNEIEHEYLQPMDIFIKKHATSFVHLISLRTPLDAGWEQMGTTIVGKAGQGNQSCQLSFPRKICIDDQNQTFYIADWGNSRIVEWKANAKDGRVIIGGSSGQNAIDQMNEPTDLILDRENNSLIIADSGNKRVIRWSRSTNRKQILISDIHCFGLALHNDGSLYISDSLKHEVRRWKEGEANGTVVAGGNGPGNALNQLRSPTFIFIDQDHTLFVSDSYNHRVMKWIKDAKEGVVIAGGNGAGDSLKHLSCPQGLIVNQFGQIYIADWGNDRVIRWYEGEKEGMIIVGNNGTGNQADQLSGVTSLSFDGVGNLYLVDRNNARIQKFLIDRSTK